jgi:CRP-like cAMP-binding protein
MEFLAEYLKSNKNIPNASVDKIMSLISLKSYKKKDIFAKINEIPRNFYILKSGVVRSYYIDNNGKEHIRNLFTPITPTGALVGLITNKSSKLSYDCLTDCELYAANFNEFKKLMSDDASITKFYIATLEDIFLLSESKIYDLSVLNATERYLKVKKQIANIENLIPQYHIASYLNITPVQLSRIRKEIYSK